MASLSTRHLELVVWDGNLVQLKKNIIGMSLKLLDNNHAMIFVMKTVTSRDVVRALI